MPQGDREEVVRSANTLLSNAAAGFAIHPTVASLARAVVEMDEELKECGIMDAHLAGKIEALELARRELNSFPYEHAEHTPAMQRLFLTFNKFVERELARLRQGQG